MQPKAEPSHFWALFSSPSSADSIIAIVVAIFDKYIYQLMLTLDANEELYKY